VGSAPSRWRGVGDGLGDRVFGGGLVGAGHSQHGFGVGSLYRSRLARRRQALDFMAMAVGGAHCIG
jgi:hypothetical protein